MSEARDVIARALASVGAFDSEGEATVVGMALTTAGFRILGPDEVDPVTVEKAAEAAYEVITDGEHAEEVATAVRAIGRMA